MFYELSHFNFGETWEHDIFFQKVENVKEYLSKIFSSGCFVREFSGYSENFYESAGDIPDDYIGFGTVVSSKNRMVYFKIKTHWFRDFEEDE